VVTFSEIEEAADRIADYVHHTPVLTCATLDNQSGARLFFKCENFQKVGAFKMRGATNAVFALSDSDSQAGVATHSSGNHAQALALAARQRGIPAYVVMPNNAPQVKVAAVKGYGAEIITCEPTLAAREATVAEVITRTGATLIHPFDNDHIIAGQGTAALELLQEHPEIEIMVAPVGGGGLLSGTALATRNLAPNAKIYGAEPTGADDTFRSLAAGKIIPMIDPNTVADGLLTTVGQRNFDIIRKNVAGIWTVDDDQIVSAMRLVWERMKIVIEPSAAVAVAAVLSQKAEVAGRQVGIILSGGNLDLGRLPW
jgi:threonine dehydratase